jgi:coproporphyrinogen III oxidase
MREAVLASQPEIVALSIRRTSFSSIALMGTPRTKAFIWCGATIDTGFAEGGCFESDAEGLVFRQAGVNTSTVVLTTGDETPATAGDLRIFAPLDREVGEGGSPIGARIVNHEAIPDALRFVKAIRSLNVPVSALALRGDEADLWLSGPTRITYVLGSEEMAAQLAASVVPTLDLTNGSVQYVDLRFSGKAYVKKHGE